MTSPSLFNLFAWLSLVTMSDNPTVLVVLEPTSGSTDGSRSFSSLCLPAKEFVNLPRMTRFLKREKLFGLFFLRVGDTMTMVLLL